MPLQNYEIEEVENEKNGKLLIEREVVYVKSVILQLRGWGVFI